MIVLVLLRADLAVIVDAAEAAALERLVTARAHVQLLLGRGLLVEAAVQLGEEFPVVGGGLGGGGFADGRFCRTC